MISIFPGRPCMWKLRASSSVKVGLIAVIGGYVLTVVAPPSSSGGWSASDHSAPSPRRHKRRGFIALRYGGVPRDSARRSIEIVVPEVEQDRVFAPVPAPKLFAGKSHGVEMLRARSVAPRVAVGEAEDAAVRLHDAGFAARI